MLKYKTLLNDEIKAELEAMGDMETNSEEYTIMVDGLTKLIDKSIELEKLEMDKSNHKDKSSFDKTDKIINYAINIAGIVVPVIVTIWGVKVSFEFEKEGTVTTMMGRGFINKLLPHK